jgi:hypothetical protein
VARWVSGNPRPQFNSGSTDASSSYVRKPTWPDLVFHAGHLADAGSGSVEIVDQIRELGWKSVAGNTDQMLAIPETLESFASRSRQLARSSDVFREMAALTCECLEEETLDWLRSLPIAHVHDPIAIVRAGLEGPWFAPPPETSEEELHSRFGSLAQPIVIYGHIHRPFVRTVGAFTVANAGSAGLPCDGDRRAGCLLIDDSKIEIRDAKIKIRRVEYDLAKEIANLRSSGMPHADRTARTLESAAPQMP